MNCVFIRLRVEMLVCHINSFIKIIIIFKNIKNRGTECTSMNVNACVCVCENVLLGIRPPGEGIGKSVSSAS